MRVLDLFSGIGGFSLGLEMASPEFQTVAFCEIEEYPRKILNKHWPDVPVYTDIRELTHERLKADGLLPIDLVCGGFPCQPFSGAGKREGFADDRDLWPEMFRVIQEVRPAWVIGENVAGFTSMGLERTVSNLESAGYEVQPLVIPACAVGAPHRRDRIWILASNPGYSQRSKQKREYEGTEEPDRVCRDVADPYRFRTQRDRATGEQKSRMGQQNRAIKGRLPVVRERRQWATEPDVGRVANGVPSRVDRLKGLGNAVVPQVVAEIGKALTKAHHGP